MTTVGVITLMGRGNAVTNGDISFGIVDDRIQRVVLWENDVTPEGSETQVLNRDFDAFPVDISLSDFEAFCESFNPNLPNAVLLLPEKRRDLSEDGIYDFSKLPFMECPKCFRSVGPKNAKREGRYGYCPSCGKQLYKAPRIDGQRDEPEYVEKSGNQWGSKKPKKEKAPEPTIEEHIEKGAGKTRKVSINFGSSHAT